MSGLWIRSQDREKLVKSEGLSLFIDNDCYCICSGIDGTVAIYKTKERALEVLDEIQTEVTEYLGTHAEMVYEMPEE